MMRDALCLFPEELAGILAETGQPAYRAEQIFSWLAKGAKSFAEMTNLSQNLRTELSGRLDIGVPEELRRQVSRDGTRKILWGFADGQTCESVIMQYGGEFSVCVSSQAGCRQGCAFCASAKGGLVRSLTAGEILAQVLHCSVNAGHVVLMGMGEPLDNFDEVVRFLRLVNHPKGRGLGLRHVSLSTCGLVPEILRLADLGLPVTLSVSLHAPDDETRSRLMPVNKKYGVGELMEACKKYFEKTGRRNSYEYVMIEGMNDSAGQARLLAGLLRGQPAHVNLIPLNPVDGRDWKPSPPEAVRAFEQVLSGKGIAVTVRRRLGADIDAACGQLRRRSMV